MKTWPHAPSRVVTSPGNYMITSSTKRKEHFFIGHERLELLHDALLETAERLGWEAMGWAVFSNHYHFVGVSPNSPDSARLFAAEVHRWSAERLNRLDAITKRSIWYRAWDTRITIETSFMARLAYVHYNPVKHGLVLRPEDYPYCSARWFITRGHRPFVESVLSFKTDRVNVYDDF